MVSTIRVPLLARHEIAKDTFEVSFGINQVTFPFQAGQYVSITMPGLETESLVDQRHDFSIASAPHEKETLRIAMRVSQSPFKQKLLSLPLGTLVEVQGPKGAFTFSPEDTLLHAFVAGGIGITAFMSMIREASARKSPRRLILFYYNQTPENTPYLATLREMASHNPLLSVNPIFSPFYEESLSPHLGMLTGARWYVAGSPGFVDEVRKASVRQGIPRNLFLAEEFAGYE